MTIFRAFLVVLWLTVLAYTAVVAARHGLGLIPIFFGDMAKMQWPGQFNLDFMFMLSLSALWVAWRHEFGALGLGLAVLAFVGGAAFLTFYLFVLTFTCRGDTECILTGARAYV